MSCCKLGEGGWVGGWVSLFTAPLSRASMSAGVLQKEAALTKESAALGGWVGG